MGWNSTQRRFRAITIAALMILAPLPGFSQGWQFHEYDDGSFFSAGISNIDWNGSPSGEPRVAIGCGERSPSGGTVIPGGNALPLVTPPDEFRLLFMGSDLGDLPTGQNIRQDVMIVVGATGYQLQSVMEEGVNNEWVLNIPAEGAMLQAIARQVEIEIRTSALSKRVGTAGFGAGLARLTTYCRAKFAAIGRPWTAVSNSASVAPATSMRQFAEAAIAKGCNGPSTYEPNAFLTGEIDGDGQPDTVLDWRAVTCSGAMPRPFCGASTCAADVFLSASFQRRGRPENLLALGVRLQPLNNGNMAVAVGGSLSQCRVIGAQACEFLFYWNGMELAPLP